MDRIILALSLLLPLSAEADLTYSQILQLEAAQKNIETIKDSPIYDGLDNGTKQEISEIEILIEEIGFPVSGEDTLSAIKIELESIKDSQQHPE